MSATDSFSDFMTGLDTPATSAFPITPADGADLPEITRAVQVNTAGNVAMVFVDDPDNAPVTLYLERATPYPYRLRRVLLTGTDATGIVGLT